MENSAIIGKAESMKKLVMLLLVLYPLLDIYKFTLGVDIPLVNLISFILFAVILVRKDRPKVKLPKSFSVYWAYISIVFLLFTDSFRLSLLIPGGISFCSWVITLYVCMCYFDFEYFKRYYKIILIICSVVFFIQEISYFTLGTRPIVFLRFPVTGTTSLEEIINNQIFLDRSSCFFREPAHFAQFMLPLLAIELMEPSHKDKIFSLFSIYIIITLVVLRSGNGFMGMIILIAIRLWIYLMHSKLKWKLYRFIFVISLLATISVQYIRTEQGSNIVERATGINLEEGSSSFMRTFRGYYLYDDLPTINKIFGTSIDEIPKYIAKSKVSYLFVNPRTGETDQYLNGIQTILVSNGIMGLVLFFLVFFRLYRNNGVMSKSLIFLFVSLLFISNLYLTQMMIISLLLPWLNKQYFYRNSPQSSYK